MKPIGITGIDKRPMPAPIGGGSGDITSDVRPGYFVYKRPLHIGSFA